MSNTPNGGGSSSGSGIGGLIAQYIGSSVTASERLTTALDSIESLDNAVTAIETAIQVGIEEIAESLSGENLLPILQSAITEALNGDSDALQAIVSSLMENVEDPSVVLAPVIEKLGSPEDEESPVGVIVGGMKETFDTYVEEEVKESFNLFVEEEVKETINLFVEEEVKETINLFVEEEVKQTINLFVEEEVKQTINTFVEEESKVQIKETGNEVLEEIKETGGDTLNEIKQDGSRMLEDIQREGSSGIDRIKASVSEGIHQAQQSIQTATNNALDSIRGRKSDALNAIHRFASYFTD